MQLFDTCPSFIDDIGKPLAGGRLMIYKYSSTELADVYVDSDYTTPANNPFALDNTGSMPFNVYMQESVTVHVQKFIGYDEYNVELYADQKTFDIIAADDSGTGTSVGYLNSVADLRAYAVEQGKCVTVTGYFTSGDCPARVFQYDANSSALDNNGTIIESSLTASGRWIWVPEGPTIDCRTFGVIAGSNNINANFASFIAYCASTEKIGYIPNGNYNLTQSGNIEVHAALFVDESVKINSTGTYTIALRNGKTTLKGTFAGTNVVLQITESADLINSWVIGNPIPIEAFNNQQDCTLGNVAYNLMFTSAMTFSVSGDKDWNRFIVNKALTLNTDGSFTAKSIEGLGVITLGSGYNPISVPNLKTSMLIENNTWTNSQFAAACTKELEVDSDITLSNGTVITALINSKGTITHSGTISAFGGIYGKQNLFQSDAAVNVGDWELNVDYWSDISGFVKSFNATPNALILDFKGQTASNTDVTKAGTFRNGAVRRILCNGDIILEDMIIDNNVAQIPVSATSVVATRTTFNTLGNSSLFGTNFTGGQFTNCTIVNNGNSPLTVNAVNTVWNNTGCAKANTSAAINFNITGGGAILNDVNGISTLTCIPGSDNAFGNVTVIGGSIETINFDATQMANVAEAIAYNIIMKNIAYLAGNINVVNNSSKKWAVNGHYNVQIGDNEGSGTRATYGIKTVKVYTFVASEKQGSVTDATSVCLMFNYNLTTPIESAKLIGIYPRDNRRWFGAGYGQVIPSGNHINFVWAGPENPQTNELVNITFEFYR